jgi:hypothetical protein
MLLLGALSLTSYVKGSFSVTFHFLYFFLLPFSKILIIYIVDLDMSFIFTQIVRPCASFMLFLCSVPMIV